MDKLQAFYKSPKWEKFRRVIISERTNPEDGFVRCAICKQPIVNKYDLIVHHKDELTIANVDDAMVALNPDNVECVHFKCHNEIHERFQGAEHWKPKPRKVFIVYGSPCSGKSTWVNECATKNDLIVDLDSIWQAVTTAAPYVKPRKLNSVVFRIRDELYDIIKHRSGKWQDAYIITGGALRGDRERLQQLTNSTDMVYIEASKDECLERCAARFVDDKKLQDEWCGYIEEWFERYQE